MGPPDNPHYQPGGRRGRVRAEAWRDTTSSAAEKISRTVVGAKFEGYGSGFTSGAGRCLDRVGERESTQPNEISITSNTRCECFLSPIEIFILKHNGINVSTFSALARQCLWFVTASRYLAEVSGLPGRIVAPRTIL